MTRDFRETLNGYYQVLLPALLLFMCKTWFPHGIKPMIMFVRELKQRRRRRQREQEKSDRFRLAKQQLYTCITLFCIHFLAVVAGATWKCLISRFVEDGNTRQQLSFCFPELWYCPVEFNSKKLPTFVRIKRDEISALKFEVARTHFLSDVLIAVAVLVA